MSDGRALVAAICATPDEDTPRLAYADWLDEHAGSLPEKKRESARARAELIRVQCALAALPPDEPDADTATRRVELERREEELLKNAARRKAWAKPLTPPPAGCEELVPGADWFVRGFADFAGTPYTPADLFIAAGEAFFSVGPVVQLTCRNIQGELGDRFLTQPWLARVRRFRTSTNHDLSGWIETGTGARGWRVASDGTDPESTEKVFAAPALANLEELYLGSWEFLAPGAPVAPPALANLRKLTLSGGATSKTRTFERLGELLPTDARLTDFELGSARYGPEDLRTLAALPQLATLERLELRLRYSETYPTPPLGVTGVRALTSAPFWKSLRAFRDGMGSGGLGPAEAEELAAAPPTPHMRTLQLDQGFLGERFEALAASPLLGSVTALDLSNNKFGDAGVQRLAKSPYVGRLVSLGLGSCGIGPAGVKALANAPFAANLVRLDLGWCDARKAVIDVLVAPGAFPRLRVLDLRGVRKNRVQAERLRQRFGEGVNY